ncbi:MAG TPA: polyprenol monophosphomannose synthase [Gemmatales bacterium]|nr:polyprenol monophosphomannose synthase [Gemmatales bacterium]
MNASSEPQPHPPRWLVGTATYNEAENLPRLVSAVRTAMPAADLLVIDDASPDGTGALADALAAADPQIKVLHRSGKLGLGTAILTGMSYATAHEYDFFINLDADFSHDPKYLPAMADRAAAADVVIGSRYIPGGGVRNWPWSRYLISRLVNVLCRVLLGLPANDVSGGYRCYRTDLLRRLRLVDLRSRGYSFQEEMLYRCKQAGAGIREVPIVFVDRDRGQSKVNVHEMVRSLAVLLGLGWQAWVNDR